MELVPVGAGFASRSDRVVGVGQLPWTTLPIVLS